jgi:hypothetical protein
MLFSFVVGGVEGYGLRDYFGRLVFVDRFPYPRWPAA